MCFAGTDAGIGPCNEMSLCLRFCHRFLKHETFRAGGQSRPPLRIRCVFAALFRVYLKTPNAPGQRAFLRCAASFFLEIRQYSCEKMSCATQKSLAAGHIMSFQIHPRPGFVFSQSRARFLPWRLQFGGKTDRIEGTSCLQGAAKRKGQIRYGIGLTAVLSGRNARLLRAVWKRPYQPHLPRHLQQRKGLYAPAHQPRRVPAPGGADREY